jgi:C-terminal processing protease CtpA/Prc
MNVFRETPALILDVRGDCRVPVNDIAAWFVDDTVTYAELVIHQPLAPGHDQQRTTVRPLYAAGGSGESYDGKLALLIGASSSAHAEEICMMLVVARRAAMAGSATPGHIGEVTSTVLPGGVTVFFTGAEYRYPNGHSVSRIGIHPLLSAEPTIQSIREGSDRALAAAVDYLSDIIGGE